VAPLKTAIFVLETQVSLERPTELVHAELDLASSDDRIWTYVGASGLARRFTSNPATTICASANAPAVVDPHLVGQTVEELAPLAVAPTVPGTLLLPMACDATMSSLIQVKVANRSSAILSTLEVLGCGPQRLAMPVAFRKSGIIASACKRLTLS
jgi:hypothetical protein